MVEAISPDGKSTFTMAADMGTMAELDVAYIVDDGTYLRQAGYLNENDMVRAVATLNSGGVLIPDRKYIDGAGQVKLRSLDMQAIADAKAAGFSDNELPDARVMGTQIFPASPLTRVNVMVLSPSAAASLGLKAVPLGQLLSVDKPVSTVDAPAFQATIARQVPGASAQVITPTMRSQILPYIAALIAVVAAAATVALVVALSASDMRPDLDTLDAIGAAPAMRRHVTTWQGVVLALNAIPTAVLSGLVVGVLAVITFARSGIFPDSHHAVAGRAVESAARHADRHAPAVCARRHRAHAAPPEAYPPYQLGSAMTDAPETVVIPPGALASSSVRVDTWLWATRQLKSRSQATAAVRAGHVRVNGDPVKAAYKLHVGDEVRLRIEGLIASSASCCCWPSASPTRRHAPPTTIARPSVRAFTSPSPCARGQWASDEEGTTRTRPPAGLRLSRALLTLFDEAVAELRAVVMHEVPPPERGDGTGNQSYELTRPGRTRRGTACSTIPIFRRTRYQTRNPPCLRGGL